jgi:F-type H+-transporting ATPase subunit delta
MRNKLIAQRYADAVLMNIDKSHFESFRNDIQLLENVFFEHPDYVKFIDSLLYPLKKRMALAHEVTSKLANTELWKNLFDILVKKHRFSIISDVLLDLDHAILDRNNMVKVQLKIAHEHPKPVMQNIEDNIKKILNKEIEFHVSIDPSLIGGFVASTESVLIDGSIKNNLVKLANINKK